jgi:hypothetical protein
MSDRRSIVANFGDDLTFSDDQSGEPAWAQYYRGIFGSLLVATVLVREDCPNQRDGVDRKLHLGNGAILTVDEKIRRTDFDDILLELYSDLERRTPGWTIDKKKLCDYVAYAVPKLSRCYFLPFPLLRNAFALYWKHWSDLFRKKAPKKKGFIDVPNEWMGRRWVTRNVPVDWSTLQAALCQQMHREYAGDLLLPVPIVVRDETDDAQLRLLFRDGAPALDPVGAAQPCEANGVAGATQ